MIYASHLKEFSTSPPTTLLIIDRIPNFNIPFNTVNTGPF